MTTLGIVLIILAVVAVTIGVWFYLRQQRTRKLNAQFGPEYDRAVQRFGSRERAEADLEDRQKRMEHIYIHTLSGPDRERFATEWHQIQSRFVDDPPGSIREADRVVCDLMKEMGYPVSDFEHRAADLSVDHPLVVRNYRAAHEVALGLDDDGIDTEDLRRALVYYRDLFDELLGVHEGRREMRR